MSPARLVVARTAATSAAVWLGVALPVSASTDECPDPGDCENPIVPNSGDLPWQAVVVGAVLLGVLVLGLRAVKRQRDEGRRSKLPPIG